MVLGLTARSLRRLPASPALALACLLLNPFAAHAGVPPPDAGVFKVFLQESEIGSTTFSIKANGEAVGRAIIELGGRKLDSTTTSVVAGGRLLSVETDAGPAGRFALSIAGTAGKLTVDGKPRPDGKLNARVLPFGNFSPHLLAFLLAAYDSTKGGTQKFPMMVVDGVGPKGVATLTVDVTALGAKMLRIDGKTRPIYRYALVIPGPIGNLDTEFDADVTGRILLWTVPGQKLEEVRDGFADLLLPEAPADPLLSKPSHTVRIDRKVMITMRDGVRLAADIYRPVEEGRFPVILQRTPYGRGNAVEASSYARRGYVFVAQDVRGRFDSEGEFHPFVLEAHDGYDSVEWCAAQPWASGSVGMIGASYLGFVQWAAAREGSPHLKCLIPIVSPPDPFRNIPYEFGAFLLSPDLWWANAVKDRGSLSIESPISAMKNFAAYKTLPLTGVDRAVLGRTIPFFQEWLRHSSDDSYYEQGRFLDKMKAMKPLPALHISGWFDGDGIGTKLNYAGMVAAGQKGQKLVYGPWGHAVNTTTKMGSLDFGPQSLRDLDTLYLRWFDHWLKGIDNGVDREPPVEAFLMGVNAWRRFSAWPPTESVARRWYLHSRARSGKVRSEGTLSPTPPAGAETVDRYVYDPADPFVPGGEANLKKAAAEEPGTDTKPAAAGRRKDVLAYTSARLKSDLIVAGPISLHLSAATSGPDTDWVAILSDVYPDGRVVSLCKGIVRARFRKSLSTPTLLKPGEIAAYDLDLWAAGNVFRKGHRLQVLVTSSFFPVYARNLNTGGDLAAETTMRKAAQTIYHTARNQSYLVLPVLPK